MGRLRVALGLGGLALGLGAEWVSYRSGELDAAVADLAVSSVLLGCGLVAWERRGQSRVGPLMAAAGIAWFLGSFWTATLYLHRGPLVHALLSYPSGRVSRRFGWVVVVAAYLDGAIEPLARSPAVMLAQCAAIVVAGFQGYLGEVGPRRRRTPAPPRARQRSRACSGWGRWADSPAGTSMRRLCGRMRSCSLWWRWVCSAIFCAAAGRRAL